MPIIEVSWIEGGRHPYIDPNIEALVGYTAHEVRAMKSNFITALIAPSHAPIISGLLDGGPPHEVMSKILLLILRHKEGHEVCCQATLICRYGSSGQLVEIWTALRQLPRQCQFNELEAWWKEARSTARQVVTDSLTLFPVPA